jgi:hypothetical protein
LTGSSLIQCHIRSKLRLLTRQLALTPGIPLGHLDLDSQDISLEFQDFVLDLAVLESCAGCRTSATCRGNSVVEAASVDFGIFSDLGCFCDDGEVRGCDTSEIVLVNL